MAEPLRVETEEPINPFLDNTLGIVRGPEGVELKPDMSMACGQDGYLHFSIVATVAEESAWWALDCEHAVPASMSINLLRPGCVDKGTITGRGVSIRRGKGIMVAEGQAWQDGKQLAHVVVTFTYFEKRPA